MDEPRSWNDALGKDDLNALWHVRGRRASDFAVLEVEHQDEEMARKEARHLFANGYDVTVQIVFRQPVAEWVHTRER